MVALFGPSEPDLERLRSTVQSLGTTSVPGLAAALAWRERKAEKVLAHELARPNTPLVYDPGRRVVRWALPLPDLPAAPVPESASVNPSAAYVPPAPMRIAPSLSGGGFKSVCPSCHVALQAAGTGNLAVCPQCGRLATARAATSSAERDPPAPAAVAPAPVAPRPESASSLSDRRSQELFAAWVSQSPIPCPKCRTPLRHRGVGEYSCPACGQAVRFPTNPTGIPNAPPPAAAAPPAPPAPPA